MVNKTHLVSRDAFLQDESVTRREIMRMRTKDIITAHERRSKREEKRRARKMYIIKNIKKFVDVVRWVCKVL